METYCMLLTRRHSPGETPQVFLERSGTRWQFPRFVPPHDMYNTDAQAANRLVQEQIGLSVVTRQALRLPQPAPGRPLNIYIMEMRDNRKNQNPVAEGKWLGREVLREIDLALPTERSVLAAWFDQEQGNKIPSLRLPWWQEGWFAATARWLEGHLTDRGRRMVAPVEQIRSVYTSALLRVLTDDGYVYLKVIPAPFAQKEIALTQILSQLGPAHYPVVLLAEQDRMLLADFGIHRPLSGDVPLERWEEIIRFYSQLQVSSVDSTARWLSLGCTDLRASHISAHLEELCAQLPERLHGLPQRLSSEELSRLETLVIPLRSLCDELSDYGIPDALEHGDLHAGNVALRENGFVLYDWSHACVTHPFYGFGSLLLDDDWFPGQSEALLRLRDAYLESWTEYASLPRLRTAFDLWTRLRPLFVAVLQTGVVASYQRMLDGQEGAYVAETATGNALQHMQWWLASHWRALLESFQVPESDA